MNEDTYFFDTYAFFEIINGNKDYKKYDSVKAITTMFNLAELNYGLKKEKGKIYADIITEKYAKFVVDVSIEDIKEAMDLKVKNKSLSIPDVIGYVMTKKHKVKFWTGNKQFENLPNVEFVK